MLEGIPPISNVPPVVPSDDPNDDGEVPIGAEKVGNDEVPDAKVNFGSWDGMPIDLTLITSDEGAHVNKEAASREDSTFLEVFTALDIGGPPSIFRLDENEEGFEFDVSKSGNEGVDPSARTPIIENGDTLFSTLDENDDPDDEDPRLNRLD